MIIMTKLNHKSLTSQCHHISFVTKIYKIYSLANFKYTKKH
jgi:hypothetical protein